jgi:uncharacterized membrane protein
VIAALAIGVPPSSHFIYIPVMFILGIVLGFVMGSKATKDAFALEEKKAAERGERAAKRAARHSDEAGADAKDR